MSGGRWSVDDVHPSLALSLHCVSGGNISEVTVIWQVKSKAFTATYGTDIVLCVSGGSIGEVTVAWQVVSEGRTATYGSDFLADGATLTFTPGQTRRSR